MKKRLSELLSLILALFMLFGCSVEFVPAETEGERTVYSETVQENSTAAAAGEEFSLKDVPAYSGKAYISVHGNEPYFTSADYTTKSYEFYSELDSLGRCGYTVASIGKDLMPTSSRESISSVKPTGWHSVQYDFVDGKSLYNRCHLIGFQLTGENANERNLITGTRYLNISGMLPFENMVTDYIKETGNHVMYRSTPIFEGSNLVASGVLMEGWSVEDEGDGICYCVYCYNVQPGVEIDYATGESREAAAVTTSADTAQSGEKQEYVLNNKSKKFHYPSCSGAAQISAENRENVTATREELISRGYAACGTCKP